MGLWEDAQEERRKLRAASEQAERSRIGAQGGNTQRAEQLESAAARDRDRIREFCDAMDKVGIAPVRWPVYEHDGTSSRIAEEAVYVERRDCAIVGWDLADWPFKGTFSQDRSGNVRRGYLVLSQDGNIYDTELQKLPPKRMFGSKFVPRPRLLPFTPSKNDGSSHGGQRPLSELLAMRLARAMEDRR